MSSGRLELQRSQHEPLSSTDIYLPQTIDAWQDRYANIYGLANDCKFPSRSARVDVLESATDALYRAVERGAGNRVIEAGVARIAPRIFSVVETFRKLRLVTGMMVKFPEAGCLFCGQKPCNCSIPRGPDPELSLPDMNNPQANWSVNKWQNHIGDVYGVRNKGFNNLEKLLSEIREVRSIEPTGTPQKIAFKHVTELADCMARLMAVANFHGVDLEKAMQERYFDVCWKCHNPQCTCTGNGYNVIELHTRR